MRVLKLLIKFYLAEFINQLGEESSLKIRQIRFSGARVLIKFRGYIVWCIMQVSASHQDGTQHEPKAVLSVSTKSRHTANLAVLNVEKLERKRSKPKHQFLIKILLPQFKTIFDFKNLYLR